MKTKLIHPTWPLAGRLSFVRLRHLPVALGERHYAEEICCRVSLDETLDCGEDTVTPVSEDYHTPFKFTGELKKAAIKLKPEPLMAQEQRKLNEANTVIAIAQ